MTRILRFISCLLLAGTAFADDVITLKDGRTIKGSIESGAAGEIRIKIGDNSQTLAVDMFQSIRFDHSISLPVDTAIAIRTIDPIDSSKADTSHEYAASLDDPVLVDGVEVVPASAKAVLRVTELTKPGRFNPRGRVSLSTSLVAIIVDGQRIEVQTDKVDSQSGSRAKKTAIGAGVGAGAGAAIGAVAGGAVGAGIGAAAGAAAGAATGVFKGPPPVKIASEVRFTYKLTQPVASGAQDNSTLPDSPPADTLTLRDGKSVTGNWVGLDAGQIDFLVNNQPEKHPRSEVSAVTFGPAAKPEPVQTPTVSLGQSIDQVVKILGQPRNIVDLGSKKIYTYPALKITFVDGKVTDVQ